MPNPDKVQIAPADGKLGVLIPGIGAVSTTFIAGVEAVKRGTGRAHRIADPARHHPLGQAHRRPLADDQGFRAAGRIERPGLRRLGHLRRHRLRGRRQRQGAREDPARGAQGAAFRHQADEGGVRSGVHPPHQRSQRQGSQDQDGQGGHAHGGHRAIPQDQQQRPQRDDLVRIDRSLPPARGRPQNAEGLRVRADAERSGDRAQPDLRVRGAQVRHSLRQWRAQPDHRYARRCWNWPASAIFPSAGKTSRPARRS